MEQTHVLVPVSGDPESERALLVGAAIAARWGFPLRIVSVVTDIADLGDRKRRLHELRRHLVDVDKHQLVDTLVIPADATADALIAAWSQWAILVMASTGEVYAGDHYVGSMMERIVRDSSRPAVIVGPQCTATDFDVRRIIVPTDGSDLSEAALPVAVDWAGELQCPLELVAVEDPGSAAHETHLAHLCNHHCPGVDDVGSTIVGGTTPAAGIVEAAGPDGLIVMATHGRSGLARITMGSVASEVCRTAPGPVVVVHPVESDLTAEALDAAR